MFLEGEINWTLWLGVIAAVSTLVAVVALVAAIAGRARHASATDELDSAQKAAQATDRRLLEILHAIPVALIETDLQGKFVFANRAAHQLLGRRDAELLGLRFHSATWGITFPDGRTVPPDMLPNARALRGQTVRGFQHLMVNAAARRKMMVSVTAMPIENERGEIIGSTAAIVETEALTTPEPLPAPEPAPAPGADLIRRVFEAASSALVVTDAHGRVREANPVALTLAGRSDAAPEGDFADLFLAEDRRAEGRQALRLAANAPAGEAEPILDPAQGVVWRILPLPATGDEPPALLLAGERAEAQPEPAPEPQPEPTPDPDAWTPERAAALTQERDDAQGRAEAALAEAQAARASAAEADRIRAQAETELTGARRLESVGRLTGGVAHDFNALLTVMTGALDMILNQADDPDRVRRLGRAALTAGRRGEDLTRRLSAFAEAADAPDLRVLDAGVLLRAMEPRLRALAGPGVDLLIEAPSGPAPARLDPVAFEGAVRALATNAFEAVNGQGSVAVRLETLEDGGLRLSVRDDGPGMEPGLAARASEPFFTTKPGAAGLGLSQVYAFARQSDGVLTVAGETGGGEVSVTLPPPPPESPPQEPASQEPASQEPAETPEDDAQA